MRTMRCGRQRSFCTNPVVSTGAANGMSGEAMPVNIPRGLVAISATLPGLFAPDAKVAERFLEFFTANIPNRNTPRAYCKAAGRLSE